ncbi:MAG: PsiF family protein [Burkholderiales bacterium]
MKQLIAALFTAAVCIAPTYAQELTPQQKRMQQCNADAKNKQFKNNDERQAFMSTCLKGGGQMTQQDKMTACNKEAGAKSLKGDDRKAFMSKCLSG